MERYYTMKDVAIACQQLVEDSDQERNGTSEANISNFFTKCFDKLGLQKEWEDKKTGKAYEFTGKERDALIKLFQNRDTILKKIQEERIENEIKLLFNSNYIDMDLRQRIDAQNRVNKDRIFQDLDRKYKGDITEEEREKIKVKLEKREAELSTKATDAVIDRGPHPLGYSPPELLDKARKKVGVPCYKANCDMRTN